VFIVRVIFNRDLEDFLYVFKDRFDAGLKLASWLRSHDVNADIVYAIPAGGVPVGYLVAKNLNLLLDVLICRKLLIPWNRESGFGAIAPDGTYFYSSKLVFYLALTPEEIKNSIEEQLAEINRRLQVYRCGERYTHLNGKKVLVVDDGIAAGFTMIAATRFLRKIGASKVIIAVPTCHVESAHLVAKEADEVYCLNPRSGALYAVADAYVEWRDLGDKDVLDVLREAKRDGLLSFKAECF
jgi:predicted phosphoribosyltransferase